MESGEFDSTLGGAEHLPYSANIFKFAVSRSVEIAAMTESVIRPSKTKLIFQSLPVHMRRRVMSHNCKRLPRNLRVGHMEQLIKSGFPPKQKRPSRKYRRRPTNLLQEYNRRKRRHIWLETHIWHAKRFHMVDRWGHRLAYSPCDKAFRACYRATSAHCLLQDISYYTPLRIRGPLDAINNLFTSITSKSCGLGICAKAYLSGNREGTIHLYKPNLYPFGYIGKVQFLWVVVSDTSKELWLFVHPSQIDIVKSVLSNIINPAGSEESFSQPKKRKIENKQTGKIEIESMAGAVNRFRLTGPRSQAVLFNCLKCVTNLDNVKHNNWVSYYNQKDPVFHLDEKYQYWQSLGVANSPSQLPPRLVLGLVVKDPRISRPKYRTKAQFSNNNIDIPSLLSVPQYSSISPLWDATVRDKIKSNKITNPQFVEHITKTQLIPGEVNEDDPGLQSIPIVLIQRRGSQNSEHKKIGYGSGWDIILPSGYGLPFWLTFIMFGARSGGLRETESLSFEMGECYLPPDSDAGHTEEMRIETKLKEHYFKRPPSKRVNYMTYGISNPFLCPWKILLKDWCNNTIENYFILRDRFHLNDIQDRFDKKEELVKIEKADHCLVAVYIQILGKGSLGNHALICMPQGDDIKSVKTLSEPRHEDTNLKLRKLKRLEHRKTLRHLKKMCLKLRKKVKKTTANGKSYNPTEPSEYVKQMRELWVPSNVSTVRFSGARQTMGYVSNGAFSFSEAKSCGVGYIAYNALFNLIDNGCNKVLIRNTTTLKYRLATIQIIKDL
ncbi:ribonucleases P/MRP protein subunit POP1 [Epargyreus clarus]|uniref:ribonucleases P/MRP protein subunit POP1 n=1 Tax=Epargyreus clarus TaxID=520877 RepID=UPI003C2ED937